MNEIIIDGTEIVNYAHQIEVDTQTNKPFEMRSATVELSYYPANFEGDVDNYVVTVKGGEFDGISCAGNDYIDAIHNISYKLMDESRKIFIK